jgi:hypothetical protein
MGPSVGARKAESQMTEKEFFGIWPNMQMAEIGRSQSKWTKNNHEFCMNLNFIDIFRKNERICSFCPFESFGHIFCHFFRDLQPTDSNLGAIG